MRVLMFGWEFPPHLSGGLGTACFGLTKALTDKGVDITFVLPKVLEQANSHVQVFGPNQLTFEEKEVYDQQYEHLIKHFWVDTIINPYMNEETYREALESRTDNQQVEKNTSRTVDLDLTGNYGPNLMSEVVRFSLIGEYLGKRNDFDLIHAHDWPTFLAAIEAKKTTGKPLIVHIHATEFDRSGENVNQEIYDIERFGMEEADKVVAVSHRTKEMLVEKYSIHPDKIDVVYNGVEQANPIVYDKEKRPFKDDKMVLFLGRITSQKGPHYFLDAANMVLKVMPNVRFIMAGAGDLTRTMS